MSTAAERLRARVAELKPAPKSIQRMSARELLNLVLEHIDLECFLADGRARVVAELPPKTLDDLCEWDGDERETDEDIEAVAP